MTQVHGTAVSIGGRAVLFRGPPGSGKSDLALRLIDGGATLIADDRCDLTTRGNGTLVASAPAELAGMIEVRGLGVVRLDAYQGAPLMLVANLVEPDTVERLPETRTCTDYGRPLPLIAVAPFEASAPAKVRLALAVAAGEAELVP